MARKLPEKQNKIVVELTNDWLKVFEVSASGPTASIINAYAGKVNFADESSEKTIARIVADKGFQKLPAIAVLPRQIVNVRMLDLPSSDPEEIRDMVGLQADKQTPYSRDEIVFDHRILGTVRDGYTRIMLVILQRSILRERFGFLERVGLNIEKMTISSEGLLNWHRKHFVQSENDKPMAILDVDSYYSDYTVVTGRGTEFTRSILVGADQLKEDFEKWKEKFVQEIKRSMDMSKEEVPDVAADKILLSGSAANVQNLGQYLGTELGAAVTATGAFEKFARVPEFLTDDPAYGAVSFTSLAGLAWNSDNIELNFMPESAKMRKELKNKATCLAAFGMTFMALIMAITTYASLKINVRKNILANMIKQNAEQKEEVQRIRNMIEIIKVVNRRGNTAQDSLSIMRAVHSSVSADMKISMIEIDAEAGTVTVAGTAGSLADVRALTTSLEQTPIFKSAGEKGASTRVEGKYRFQVSAVVEEEI